MKDRLIELRYNALTGSKKPNDIEYIHMLTETGILLKKYDEEDIGLILNSILMDLFTYKSIDVDMLYNAIITYDPKYLNSNMLPKNIDSIHEIIKNIIYFICNVEDIFDEYMFIMLHIDLMYLVSGNIEVL